MLKIIPSFISLLFLTFANAQDTLRYLEGNNIRATISNSGNFFCNRALGRSGYESPKDGGNHLIYSTSFWYGAIDESDRIKMAADGECGESRDTYPGALTNDGSAGAPVPGFATDIYLVSRAEIEYHVSNIYTPGYVIPHGILEWPAHGDVALGLDYQLAPFADLNGNAIYEPELGEYPEIRGDHAAYLIMNDKAGPHSSSGGDPLGIEIHYMFYQFESEDDEINNTTFLNVRVINRSTANYPEFIVGSLMDSDVGYGLNDDDFIGCSPENNLIYGYNADNFDEGGGSQPGYGENPPAVGMMVLNRTMNVGGTFDRDPSLFGWPSSPSGFWLYQNARWQNGNHFTFGGQGRNIAGTPTNFIYPSDPTNPDLDPLSWSEITVSNSKGDRRVFMASESISLPAGGTACFDYAFLTSSRIGNSIENASALIAQAPSIQAFYNGLPNIYCDYTLAINESESINPVSIYPNPSNGTFTVDLFGSFDLDLFGIDGRSVHSEQNVQGSAPITTNLASGTYLITVTQDNKTYQSKIVIRN